MERNLVAFHLLRLLSMLTPLFSLEDGDDVLVPKRWAFSELHRITTHRTAFIIVTAVRTSNPVWKLVYLGAKLRACSCKTWSVLFCALLREAPVMSMFRNACSSCSMLILSWRMSRGACSLTLSLPLVLISDAKTSQDVTRMLHNSTYPRL
jgi:hypothetical protein